MLRKNFLMLFISILVISITDVSVYPDVLSSGGTIISSDDNTYTLKFTLGQSTPVSDPLTTGTAESETLKPGYIYTSDTRCVDKFDRDTDEDVDGKDVAAFAAQLAGNASLAEKLGLFARSFAGYECE